MFQKYRGLINDLSLSELARAFVDEIGILSIFKEEGTPESLARRENVMELLSAISEYSEEHEDATLENFLQEVSLISDIDKWDNEVNAVTLMTLHSAKGLEFPVVFITGLEEGLLPYYNSTLDPIDLEEERRLFYVGITRTIKKLFLSYAHQRFRFTDISFQTPSRFLEEIDSNLIERSAYIKYHHYDISSVRLQKNKSQKKVTRKSSDFKDQFYSDLQPDYDNQVDVSNELRTGALIEHDTFGRGKIIFITGEGDSCKIVVDFESVGKKNLMLKYAPIKIL